MTARGDARAMTEARTEARRMPRVLDVVASIAARMPAWVRAAFGVILGWLAGTALRIRRTQVETAMARAGIASPRREAAGMYRALGVGVGELLWLAGGDADIAPVIAFDDASRARWDDARRGGKGIVLAASHTGNWELAACAIAREVELVAVVKRLTVGAFDSFCARLRSDRGVRAVTAHGALTHARATLRRGGVVAMIIDQVPGATKHASHVEFLGAMAHVDRAPATLAARSGAPLVVIASRRIAKAHAHTIEILDVLTPPARAGRAWIEEATRASTAALDRFVRAHPRDWLWLHRRWRAPSL